MADYNLEALSLPELKKMQKDITKPISTYEDRQKAGARTKVEAVAREMGYSMAELVGTDSKPKRAPVAPKYQHPENSAAPGPVVGVNRSGSWRRWLLAHLPVIWKSAERLPTFQRKSLRLLAA